MSGPFEAVTGQVEAAKHRDPLGAFIEAEQHALLIEALGPREGELIIDIGADTGRVAREVARYGPRIIATEPSPSLLELGKSRSRGIQIEWRAAPSDVVPVEDGAADAALLVTTLEFVRDRRKTAAEAWRVIRPGGRLVVGVLGALSPWAALYRLLGAQGVSPWNNAWLWTEDDLFRLLPSAAEPRVRSAVYLGSGAQPPFPEADAAGRRAGNHPAYLVARWDKPLESSP